MKKAPLVNAEKNLWKTPVKGKTGERCVKSLENVESLPVKRAKYHEHSPHCNLLDTQTAGIERFCNSVDKLETLLHGRTAIIKSGSLSKGEDDLDLEFEQISVKVLKKLTEELNESYPLNENHLKVFEKYGVDCEEIRKGRGKEGERNEGERRIDKMSEDELRRGLPKKMQTWGLPKGLKVVKLAPGFSIRKEMMRVSLENSKQIA